MSSINAISIAVDMRDWLATSRQTRILHVFDEACNLINERGEVLSLVTQRIGNGPFNLVIEDHIGFSKYLNIESSISIGPDQITLGSLFFDLQNAELWSPRPDWETLHARKEYILNQLILLPITNYQPQLPPSLLSTLSTSIVGADLPSSLATVRGLAGLGQGLTPAGDDFILGAILAVWIIHPLDVARVLAEEIKNTAAPLTTSLSAAWLRSAGRGEAGILWHDFLDALIYAGPVRIQESMSKILAVGETSGADALTGFFGTVMRWAELASPKTP